jgi:thiamine pyrophosphokinase
VKAATGGGSPRHLSSATLAVVFLGGVYEDAAYYRSWAAAASIVVAADGGARFLLDVGGAPDVVVGDFDSLPVADAERLAGLGVATVRHSTRKDQTDGELAVDEALRRGAGELVLAGALGALDHTLGHLAILRRLAERGVPARLASPDLSVRVLVAPAKAVLDAQPRTRVSVVPVGADAVVTLTGFDYPLTRGVLPAASCLGLGNFIDNPGAEIEVHKGAVAVLVEGGRESFGGAPAPGPKAGSGAGAPGSRPRRDDTGGA